MVGFDDMCPLVSVLIPCYNAEPWLAQAIQSVLHQIWQKLEIIIVDDGSTDQSFAIAQSLKLPNVKVIKQPHQGVAAARNRALQVAQGEYIQYLDPHDLLSPNKIAAQLLLLRPYPADTLAICDMTQIGNGDGPEEVTLKMDGGYNNDLPMEWLIRLLQGPAKGLLDDPAAWLLPRTTVERAGFWDEQFTLTDYGEYLTRIVLASNGIQHSPICRVYQQQFSPEQPCNEAEFLQQKWLALQSLDLKANHLLRHKNSESIKRKIAQCYTEYAMKTYSDCPAATDIALQRIRALKMKPQLPGCESCHDEVLRIILAWRAAKILSLAY